MKAQNIFLLFTTFVVISSFTGCYTQVATSDSSTLPENQEPSDVTNYYSDEDEDIGSGYYSETDIDTLDDETTIINNYYYDYPYRSYFVDYYPTISIGFGWGWGYWGYPYWPYYAGWCGYGWYYPYSYYCYYPSYYYYDPYYYPYYGNGGYYSDYGYKTRNDYVSRMRNNSGGRNYGERTRDPLVSVRDGSMDRSREDLTKGRNLTVSGNNVGDRTLGIENKTRDLTREVVGLNTINRTRDIKKDKQLGLDREVTTKKSLGINQRNDGLKEKVSRNNTKNISERINKNNRISTETKKLFGKDNSRTNTNTKQPNVNNRPNNTQTPRKDNNTRSYTPPKQNNNNPPRNYSPPNTNNTPRSYSPPSGNNTPRSYSPPTRNSGSTNSGTRRR